MYEPRSRALEGRRVSSKSPSRVRDGDEGVARRNVRERIFSQQVKKGSENRKFSFLWPQWPGGRPKWPPERCKNQKKRKKRQDCNSTSTKNQKKRQDCNNDFGGTCNHQRGAKIKKSEKSGRRREALLLNNATSRNNATYWFHLLCCAGHSTTSSSPPQCATTPLYCTGVAYWLHHTVGEVNMLIIMLHGIGGTQGEEVVNEEEVVKRAGGRKWTGSAATLPLFLIFGFLSVSSAHLGHQNKNLQIFGNLQIFLLIFAIFRNFSQFLFIWVCLLSILARKMKKIWFSEPFFTCCELFGCGPCGPGGPPGPPGPWCKSIFSPI